MDKNEIVLAKESEDFVRAQKNKKREKRKRKRLIYKLGLIILLGLAIAGTIKHMPDMKNVLNIYLPKSNQPSSEQGTNHGSQNTNEGTSNEIEEIIKIPEGSYQILDTGPQKYELINESGCEIEASGIKIITVSETAKSYGSTAPLVLVTALHIRESYSNGKFYSETSEFYSDTENVGELCEIIANELSALGINAISITELYASGSLYGSRSEYEKSLSDTLKKYPSISYVFDISRGIDIKDDLTMEKKTANLNGDSVSQISLISGTSSSTLSEEQRKNVQFALDFAKFSFESAPCLVFQNKISRFPISQNVSPFVCEVEIGTFANSFDEAKCGAISFASLFSSYLLSKES